MDRIVYYPQAENMVKHTQLDLTVEGILRMRISLYIGRNCVVLFLLLALRTGSNPVP